MDLNSKNIYEYILKLEKENLELKQKLNVDFQQNTNKLAIWRTGLGGNYPRCSACGFEIKTNDNRDLSNFCPNCGAKMDVEEKNDSETSIFSELGILGQF